MNIFTQFKNWIAGMYETFRRNRQGFDVVRKIKGLDRNVVTEKMLHELNEFMEEEEDQKKSAQKVQKVKQSRDANGRFTSDAGSDERYHGKNDNRIERP